MVEQNGKTVILVPGPPNELYPMMEKQICPYLQKKNEEVILSQMVKSAALGRARWRR